MGFARSWSFRLFVCRQYNNFFEGEFRLYEHTDLPFRVGDGFIVPSVILDLFGWALVFFLSVIEMKSVEIRVVPGARDLPAVWAAGERVV